MTEQAYHVAIGQSYWFEYHCEESHNSADAELWYHSHQRVIVLGVEAEGSGDSEQERLENGHPAAFKVRFTDGFEHTAIEDELLDFESEYCRPNPPKSL